MNWERPEINTFIVQPPLKDRSQIIIYLNQLPRSGRDQERLFGLAEIKTPELSVKNDIQIFLTQLATKYQEESIENPSLAFEQTLEWANRILRERLDQKKLSQINLLFGCLKNDLLQFAVFGDVISYIFFKEKNSYRQLDLLKTYTSKAEGRELYFSNLISGELHHNNFVFFTLPNLLDFLSLERIEKIITQTKPENVCDHLETILNQIENKLAFGGLLIEWPDNDWQMAAALPIKIPKATPDSSIKNLLKQEEETAKILTPSLFSSLRSLWQKKHQTKLKAPSENVAKNQEAETLRRINKIYTRLTGWQGNLKNLLQRFLIGLGKVLFKTYLLFKKIPHFKIADLSFKIILIPFTKLFSAIKNNFLAIPIKKRIFITLGAIIIITLAGSLTYTFSQKESRLQKDNYNQLLSDIKNRLDEAESSLIYKNENEAKIKLQEIKNLFSSLPAGSNANDKNLTELKNSYQQLTQKIQHIQNVNGQLEIDLTKFNNEKPSLLTISGRNLILAYPTTSSIGVFNMNTQKLATIEDSRLNKIISWTLQKDDTILILNDQEKLFQFNPKNSALEAKDITWLKQQSDISLIASYNGNLYAIDKSFKEISKHSPSTTGFGKGEPWITDKSVLNFDDATDLMIDGSLYVSKNNGEIWKFEKGQKKIFNLSNLEAPLSGPIKIYTKSGSDLLFILDPQNKKTLIWNKKTNQIISQLISADLHSPVDFFPDEQNKKIYLIDENKIVSLKY